MKEPYFAWEDIYKAINGPGGGISKRVSIDKDRALDLVTSFESGTNV